MPPTWSTIMARLKTCESGTCCWKAAWTVTITWPGHSGEEDTDFEYCFLHTLMSWLYDKRYAVQTQYEVMYKMWGLPVCGSSHLPRYMVSLCNTFSGDVIMAQATQRKQTVCPVRKGASLQGINPATNGVACGLPSHSGHRFCVRHFLLEWLIFKRAMYDRN